VTYRDLIQADIKYSKLALTGTDVFDINIAAYHCQQAVEKTCGYLSQKLGVPSKRTHKIEVWMEYLKDLGVKVPALIDEKALTISEWESSSRYNINFVEAKRSVADVLAAVESWLDEAEVARVKRIPRCEE